MDKSISVLLHIYSPFVFTGYQVNSQSGSQAEMLNKLNGMLGDLGKLVVICLSFSCNE